MRDTLPGNCNRRECGILNLDSIRGSGTHWTCWYKVSNKLCYYFDSFGLTSLQEFDEYIKCNVLYSTYEIQKVGDIICGHLCLIILYHLAVEVRKFHSILLELFSLYNK